MEGFKKGYHDWFCRIGMKACDLADRLNSVEKYALALAGANKEDPIKGKLWWQKEMFLIEKNVPELSGELDFEPALKGPMSEALEWEVDQLVSLGLIESRGYGYGLTGLGRECWASIRSELGPDQLSMISELKAFLNDLNKEELLAVVYFVYPEMTVESHELKDLIPKRKDIAIRLFVKKKVGMEKASIIAGLGVQDFARLLKQRGIAQYSD